ncbi:MAG: hypothetical protein V4467_00010 [Patescibacteria group bacterium]
MSIKDYWEKIKFSSWLSEGSQRYYTTILIILVGLSSFGLGRLSVANTSREPITIEQGSEAIKNIDTTKLQATAIQSLAPTQPAGTAKAGGIVASKNGTKYYFPWCGSANNIAEKNKVWFNSEAEARAKGYEPASNCKGLK